MMSLSTVFVADFIGESNIITGVMMDDFVVEFANQQFTCVDRGFAKNERVDIVIRPEDLELTTVERGKLRCARRFCFYSVVCIMSFVVMMRMGTSGSFTRQKKQKLGKKSAFILNQKPFMS
ncbi:MAG: hypothetical protein KatS3mg080_0945 [Anoxybacillus sp.]|nr:MAG: hypothetical protein KatS3mg080_0945 [Anoxybacillus sp.]